MPEYEGIFTTTSHLTGEKINRFCNIHQSPEDLLAKQEMTRVGARRWEDASPDAWASTP